jgi:hypothetical protein
MNKTIVYLGSPYSRPNPVVREARFQAVCQAAAHLMKAGLHVFSPIAHTHPISLAGSLPDDWEYWQYYDEAMLSTCRAFVSLRLEGWEESTGLRNELKIATRLKLATFHTNPAPEDLDLVARLLLHELPHQPDEKPLIESQAT